MSFTLKNILNILYIYKYIYLNRIYKLLILYYIIYIKIQLNINYINNKSINKYTYIFISNINCCTIIQKKKKKKKKKKKLPFLVTMDH